MAECRPIPASRALLHRETAPRGATARTSRGTRLRVVLTLPPSPRADTGPLSVSVRNACHTVRRSKASFVCGADAARVQPAAAILFGA